MIKSPPLRLALKENARKERWPPMLSQQAGTSQPAAAAPGRALSAILALQPARLLLGILLFSPLACLQEQGPPFSPQKALQTFRLPEGFQIEVVASEPDIADPVALAFDARGRLFVLEMSDYPMEEEPRGRVKLLEDLDGDGRFNRVQVFAENLHFPTGILAWREGILVAAAPHIFHLKDTTGDGRADERRIVLTGFNPYNPQLRVNGLFYALDNWIYGAYPKVGPSRRHPEQFGQPGEPLRFPEFPQVAPLDIAALGSDFRFRPDLGKLEPASGNSQYGNTFDAQGNRFALWNSNHIRHVVLDSRYLARNPHLAVPSAMHFPSDHHDQSIVYPITENPVFIHESQVGQFTSACGNSVYTGGRFPAPYEGAYFVCEPVHNLVHCDLLEPRGATFVARRALQEAEFLASTDSWFKPVFTTVGPDGALYLADYYRKYVEHPDYVPEGMEGEFDLREGEGMGRIYRIFHRDSPPEPAPPLAGASPEALVRELGHPNLWRRLTAQRLLVERRDRSPVPQLEEWALRAELPEGRFHALWTLQGLGALRPEVVLEALEDESPAVRRQAVRLAEEVLTPEVRRKLVALAEDPDDGVIFQLACTLGGLPEAESFPPLQRIALRYLNDPWYQLAVLTSAADNAMRWFQCPSGIDPRVPSLAPGGGGQNSGCAGSPRSTSQRGPAVGAEAGGSFHLPVCRTAPAPGAHCLADGGGAGSAAARGWARPAGTFRRMELCHGPGSGSHPGRMPREILLSEGVSGRRRGATGSGRFGGTFPHHPADPPWRPADSPAGRTDLPRLLHRPHGGHPPLSPRSHHERESGTGKGSVPSKLQPLPQDRGDGV